MHDIRAIRADPAAYDTSWALRGLSAQTPAILALDEAAQSPARVVGGGVGPDSPDVVHGGRPEMSPWRGRSGFL